jgi:hypothetical protein
MPRIPVYTVDTAPEDSRDPLKALEAKFGKVLNIHGEMAHSPVVLQSYTALQNVITNYGTFGPAPAKPSPSPWASRPLQLLPVRAHRGRHGGRTERGRDRRHSGEPRRLQPKLAALLAVAREATGNVGEVDDQTWQNALLYCHAKVSR